MTIGSPMEQSGAPPSFLTIPVISGDLRIATLNPDMRLITADDSALRAAITDRLGPGADDRWIADKEAAYGLVHHLRISAATMPERGAISWPTAPAGCVLNTTWGRLGVTTWPWKGISVDISKASDQAGINEYMNRAADTRWNERYSNWVIDKPRLDHIVLAHWAPSGSVRVPMAALAEIRTDLPPSRRLPKLVEGHQIVTEPGRDGKIDRRWYKANQRWSRARCPLGEYFVFDLHDGCKAVMTSCNAIHDLLRHQLGARRFSPVNGYVLEAASVPELNAAIAAAAGTVSEPGLRLV